MLTLQNVRQIIFEKGSNTLDSGLRRNDGREDFSDFFNKLLGVHAGSLALLERLLHAIPEFNTRFDRALRRVFRLLELDLINRCAGTGAMPAASAVSTPWVRAIFTNASGPAESAETLFPHMLPGP